MEQYREEMNQICWTEGGTPVQTEIIEKIGHPVNASDTADGITISADAIIGDSNNLCIVYSLKNEDGSAFTLPEGVEPDDLFFNGDYGTDIPLYMGGLHGSIGFEKAKNADGNPQIIENLSADNTLPSGKNVTARFSNLSYFDENGKIVELNNDSWKIRYELTCEDTGTSVSVNKQFAKNNLEYNVESVDISPIAISANYSVNALMKNDYPSGKMSDEQEAESDKFLNGIQLSITKKDGTVIDLTNSGGSVTPDGKNSIVCKSTTFDEIVPLAEIQTITVGDLVIPVDLQ